jgi:hypothetical protein
MAAAWYRYRAQTVDGPTLIQRLLRDGLAAPAARDMPVDDVVWQVNEANAVDWSDPADAYLFPRRLGRRPGRSGGHEPRGGDR